MNEEELLNLLERIEKLEKEDENTKHRLMLICKTIFKLTDSLFKEEDEVRYHKREIRETMEELI